MPLFILTKFRQYSTGYGFLIKILYFQNITEIPMESRTAVLNFELLNNALIYINNFKNYSLFYDNKKIR